MNSFTIVTLQMVWLSTHELHFSIKLYTHVKDWIVDKMKTVKAFAFACAVLLSLTGGKCSFISSFSDDDDEDDEEEGIIIVVSNAERVASDVVETLTQTLMVADISSQSAQYINNLNTSSTSIYSCDNNSGSLYASVVDLDNSSTVSKGDDLVLNYKNCAIKDTVANGKLEISINNVDGILIGTYSSGTNWTFNFDVNADLFDVNTNNKTFKISGNLKISLQFNATLVSLITIITSDTLTVESSSKNTLSNINISQTINLATMPSNYSLTVDSLKLINKLENTVVNAIANSIPFTGLELLELNEYFVDLDSPDNGLLILTGKNSSAEVSILQGKLVFIDVDTNSDSVSDKVISSNWTKIEAGTN